VNRARIARALRDLARSAEALADEIALREPQDAPYEVDCLVDRLQSIQLEGVLSRALNVTSPRPPKA
jgi:hypothetical protein